jgi:predicted nucleic acid-binding protein
MILLDTNVVSEHLRPRPKLTVLDWIDAQPATTLYICTPVLAELRFGAERLQLGHKQTNLRVAIEQIENNIFGGRVLPFDAAAAAEYGRLVAGCERIGRRIELMDALIAAIALTQRADLATRDVADFVDLGIKLINPFDLG